MRHPKSQKRTVIYYTACEACGKRIPTRAYRKQKGRCRACNKPAFKKEHQK